MKSLSEQKRIFKINSKILRANKWDLTLSLDDALSNYPDLIVTIGDSQILRWIDELNGIDNYNEAVENIKNEIRNNRQKNESSKIKRKRKELYNQLYQLEFQKDYICVVMNSLSDYDRANQGFTVNGIRFRRLLGTNGGIKTSTIVYINEALYPEIKRRIDNGRNLDMELVPAKLEAYQALVCSGSTPIPEPSGVIVVDDCITRFKEDVITISNENDGEPILQYISDYEIEHNNSDGFGLMLPSYSSKVNKYLTGDDEPLTGMNTRWAWTKGMCYTFSFDEFADEVAGSYEIKDVWGTVRDIRSAEMILTASMLKLWDSYKSWEDYYKNTKSNNYQLSITKICPRRLENKRTTNYQFLQSYQFSNEEIAGLCDPTIEDIKDVLGGDWRKSLLYLAGQFNTDSFRNLDDSIKALSINPEMINDPYIISMIQKNIEKKISETKKGKIEINGNYAMIGGDPYALCQSMFGLPVTGLLKAGEVYHRYWIDRSTKEIVCFRAPMSCANNIRKMAVSYSLDVLRWFKYIKTACILNAWDSTCEATNGSDFDGDTFFTTNNLILITNTTNEKTIICQQQKAEKKIVTESDIIAANKIAFNDEIGAITNRVTAMFEKRAQFKPGTPEYRVLSYRIMCGQHYQQTSIDAAKGIISKPMPESWYKITDDMTDFEKSICVDKKPYFMIYVYPEVMKEYKNYIKKTNKNAVFRFGQEISELEAIEDKSTEIQEYLNYYYKFMPVGISRCTINKICYFNESAFDDLTSIKSSKNFDYTILKSDVTYSKQKYNKISIIYHDYKERVNEFMKLSKKNRMDKDDILISKMTMISDFARRCAVIVPDESALCNILIDLLYTSNVSKSFVWAMCGRQIVKNLLSKSNNEINIPIMNESGDFQLSGVKYQIERKKLI